MAKSFIQTGGSAETPIIIACSGKENKMERLRLGNRLYLQLFLQHLPLSKASLTRLDASVEGRESRAVLLPSL